jgi:hypothetical protein
MKTLLILVLGIILGGVVRDRVPAFDKLERAIEEKASAVNVMNDLAQHDPQAFEAACQQRAWVDRTQGQ